MKRFIFCLLISMTFLMSQEPCEGTCLSEEQTKEVFNGLKELEFKDSTNTEIISNLNGQIKLYLEQHANDSLLIDLNKQKSFLLNDRIDLYKESLCIYIYICEFKFSSIFNVFSSLNSHSLILFVILIVSSSDKQVPSQGS